MDPVNLEMNNFNFFPFWLFVSPLSHKGLKQLNMTKKKNKIWELDLFLFFETPKKVFKIAQTKLLQTMCTATKNISFHEQAGDGVGYFYSQSWNKKTIADVVRVVHLCIVYTIAT